MTQRERVLYELDQAGEAGVRSDTFLELHIPRAAARILELKAEGHEITSTREGQFVRYRKSVGKGTEDQAQADNLSGPSGVTPKKSEDLSRGLRRAASPSSLPGGPPIQSPAPAPSLLADAGQPYGGSARLFDESNQYDPWAA